MDMHLVNEAQEGSLVVGPHPRRGICGEASHTHLVHDQVLGGHVWPLVVGAPVEFRLLKVVGAPEDAALLPKKCAFRQIIFFY